MRQIIIAFTFFFLSFCRLTSSSVRIVKPRVLPKHPGQLEFHPCADQKQVVKPHRSDALLFFPIIFSHTRFLPFPPFFPLSCFLFILSSFFFLSFSLLIRTSHTLNVSAFIDDDFIIGMSKRQKGQLRSSLMTCLLPLQIPSPPLALTPPPLFCLRENVDE